MLVKFLKEFGKMLEKLRFYLGTFRQNNKLSENLKKDFTDSLF